MPLPGFSSICSPTAPKIVSSENGRSHIAINRTPKQVSHYHVDGVVLKQGKKCDYLLLNETDKIAYLIELKGKDLLDAAQQLEATEQALRQQLRPYSSIQYRIVASKCKTQKIEGTSFKKYRERWQKNLQYRSIQFPENI